MAKAKAEVIQIPAIDIREFKITIVGDTPLIVHKFSEKSKREILEKQMKKATTKTRETKNPVGDFIESLYWLSNEPKEHTEEAFNKAIKGGAKFGFPSIAFKAAACSAGYRAKITKDKVTSYGAFHIDSEYAVIDAVPEMLEDMVRIQGTSADVRYRGEFKNWKTTFTIKYNAGVYSIEQVINLFNIGGFACGVGEWRPEKGGMYGMFHVE